MIHNMIGTLTHSPIELDLSITHAADLRVCTRCTCVIQASTLPKMKLEDQSGEIRPNILRPFWKRQLFVDDGDEWKVLLFAFEILNRICLFFFMFLFFYLHFTFRTEQFSFLFSFCAGNKEPTGEDIERMVAKFIPQVNWCVSFCWLLLFVLFALSFFTGSPKWSWKRADLTCTIWAL